MKMKTDTKINSDTSPTSVKPEVDDALVTPTEADDAFVTAAEIDELDVEASAQDPVRLYLNAIGKVALLTAEQEVEIAQRIETGLYAKHRLENRRKGERMTARLRADLTWLAADGERAKDELINANLRLVVSVAKKYARPSMPLLDLIQEGNLGLVRAVEKFDYRRGFKFSTYAVWWIRQAMTRGMAEQSRTVRLPVHLFEEVNKLGRARRHLRNDLNREPTVDELAEAAGLTPERVDEITRIARDPVSLDRAIGDDGTTEFGDLVADDEAVAPDEVLARRSLRGELENALDVLDEREQRVLAYRFGLVDGREYTLQQVGQLIGLTRERIRQIERDALAKLRDAEETEALRDYAV
ncbi:MAG: polymerase nonessential primary-like sigma factor [Frankiales bacterium]|jgi:RNA polymerase sigma factor (sigma-70 family)|nr:polymerase nonessential primary-like sigma factor [Frankiales bacterium]